MAQGQCQPSLIKTTII